MPLESLLDLVETLRARIDSHGSALRQSEALTRHALIDPLLRELGWDTSNPDMVVPEYNSGNGRADYALISNGSPVMMVEAKKLHDNLHDRARSQGVQYCIEEGTRYFSVTDGQRWEIYETHRPVPIDEKRIVSWDLNEASSAEVCLKALALWRPSVQSGRVVVAQEPVVLSPSVEIGTSPAPITIVETTQPMSYPTQVTDESGWTPLSNFSWVKDHPSPAEIMFPDGSSAHVNAWYDLMVESARWLISKNILTARNCPIQVSNKRFLVSTAPTHPTGNPMRTPKAVNSLYVEVHYQASQCVRNARTIIEHVGQDPEQFKVRFS